MSLLNGQMKYGNNQRLRNQYNYFLLESAREAQQQDPTTLYGKIFESSPANKEAFNVVFNGLVADQQYEEALHTLNRHRRNAGNSKELDMKELTVYRRMGNQVRIAALTREYFEKYPEDTDLRESFVLVTMQRAKDNMNDGKINEAITDWNDIIRYGDEEAVKTARQGLYNAYVTSGRYPEAIMVLDEMLTNNPADFIFQVKKADLYYKQGQYEYALDSYEQALTLASPQEREQHIVGYGELAAPIIKNLRENYRLEEAKRYAERWLTVDPRNADALLTMVNLSYQLKDNEAMLHYARTAEAYHSEDVTFKIKLAEAMNHQPALLPDSWTLLHGEVSKNPFHEPLLNTFSHTTEQYAGQLLKEKDFHKALLSIDTSLYYKSDNKTLKYMKGLAYEGLKEYDSAYYYQGFYEPSLLELDDFKNHLLFLAQKGYRNHVGLSHLRSRYGDDHSIMTISTVEYTRQTDNGSLYTGRLNYAGRAEGKGIQGQLEWSRPWTETLSSRMDIALSNQFFAKFAANAALLYVWRPTWEAEAGIGYRGFHTGQHLTNLNLGITKDIADFCLGAKLSNFYLDHAGENFYLYNLGARAQYFMGNPKSYLLALAGVGNSPDIDFLDNQLYNSFHVFNAMVGAGAGRSITRNVSASVIGTWYNFQSGENDLSATYRNLYNLYLQVNVSF
jgi:YaiO family outer membrane protein